MEKLVQSELKYFSKYIYNISVGLNFNAAINYYEYTQLIYIYIESGPKASMADMARVLIWR